MNNFQRTSRYEATFSPGLNNLFLQRETIRKYEFTSGNTHDGSYTLSEKIFSLLLNSSIVYEKFTKAANDRAAIIGRAVSIVSNIA